MNMRSSNNPYGSFSEGTDKRIGDAYPIIQAVYEKLAELTYLAENASNLQTGQIELRHVTETNSLEWKYSNEENWNVLVVYEDFSAINSTVLAAADLTAADRIAVSEMVSFIIRGTGSPEGVVVGSVGGMYVRTDGGVSTTLYIKESGTGTSTGWVAK